MDYLGTADYLTSPMTGKVESWTHYNEWGKITHNAVLKCGQRELDMVKRYATHDYDSVLGMYYAKARFYDAEDRRFVAFDPILDASEYDIKSCLSNPVQFVQYLYVKNQPLLLIDPLGLWTLAIGGEGSAAFILRLALGGQLAVDGEGNFGILTYSAVGGGFPTANIGGTVTGTNAPTIEDLSSLGFAGGGSLTAPIGILAGTGVGAEINNTGQYPGFTVSLVVGTSFPEAHGEITYTNVYNITELLKFWGLYDTAYQTVRDYYNKLTCEQKDYFKDSFGVEFK